eukprot:s425_g28.t1
MLATVVACLLRLKSLVLALKKRHCLIVFLWKKVHVASLTGQAALQDTACTCTAFGPSVSNEASPCCELGGACIAARSFLEGAC